MTATLGTDGAQKTKTLTLTLSHEIPDLEKKHLHFSPDNVMEVLSVTKKDSQTGSHFNYEIAIRALKDGTVNLDEILNERTDYVFSFNGGATSLPIEIKKGKDEIQVTKFEAEAGKNTKHILLTFDKDVENLEIGDLHITNNHGDKVVIGELTKISGKEYKIAVEVKDYASYEVLLTGVVERNDIIFTLKNDASMPATVKKEKTSVQVTEVKGKVNSPAELLVTFDQAVEELKKENLVFTPNDVLEVTEVSPADGNKHSYLVKFQARKAEKVRLSGIENVEGYDFNGFAEGQLEVEITLPSFPDYYYEFLAQEKAKKTEETKKAEEAKEENEKKTEEIEKHPESKKETIVENSKVVSVKKGKHLELSLKKALVKEVIEKKETLVIRNKKEKVELSADVVKALAGKSHTLKLTLKQGKKAGKKIEGVKTQSVYTFKVNGKNMTVKTPVKLTLTYKGGKLPKVFLIGKKGALSVVKGVSLNKKAKTITFMTKKIRTFVIAY